MDGDDTGPEPFLSAVVSFKGRFFFFFFTDQFHERVWKAALDKTTSCCFC